MKVWKGPEDWGVSTLEDKQSLTVQGKPPDLGVS